MMAQAPYANHKIHRTTPAEDIVYEPQHGDSCIAGVVLLKADDPSAGYVAELRIGVDPGATPAPVGFRPPARV
jgi:hypothetical protein